TRRIRAAIDHEHALAEPGEVANGRKPGLAEPDDERSATRRSSHLLRRPASAFALHHDHHQRIFRLARPTSTRVTVVIQKRTMTFGSAQPLSSKWWCKGAIRKMRRPVILYEATCMITETVSTTKTPPMMNSTSSCLTTTATRPSEAPIASAPMSPMKTC